MQENAIKMFGNIFFKSKEERLCQKYSSLMNRAFQAALTNKSRSDELNARAKKVLEELRDLNYKDLDTCF